ncbi:MAG TPA: L-rhamnose catabolism isomerase [Pyrinomonadaceae bacterium]|nr:L-rhamnose catabolism isomerase [Pyrinomonadaceae bacterium]
MSKNFEIESGFIAEENSKKSAELAEDFEYLAKKLARRNLDIRNFVEKAKSLEVAVPSWGVGTGGTRFARFPNVGEPRNIFEKLEDCATINSLVRSTSAVSLHIPWDKPECSDTLKKFATERGLKFDAMNSNTFQDQIGQAKSYKFGSLSHADKDTRKQAIEHNIECIELGQKIGSNALTVWVGDGSNFAGQSNFRHALENYLESMREIYAALPDNWRIFIEHKMFEPAFYSTVISDWGTNYYCARELGEKAFCLVDLGHHAPNVNIEQIVSRLIQFGKLGGFHFNDSKYGDDDLDTGSIKPFQLFLIFNELVDAELSGLPNFNPAYMLDQSHNVTDPIESLMVSAVEVSRSYVQALLVDREKLENAQLSGDALLALATLKEAFTTDVSSILATARMELGGAIEPLNCYRTSNYRNIKAKERPAKIGISAGIV